MIQRKYEKQDDAVSPVVGVMLMLVVTIIIAGLVAAFSSGLIDATSVAPKAYFDVSLNINEGTTDENDYCIMTIHHLGGDSVDTSELEIITYYTYNYYDGSTVNPIRATNTILSTTTAVALETNNGPKAKVPYLADVSSGVPGDAAVNFGSFDFTAGDVMTTGTTSGTARVLGLPTATTTAYAQLKNALLPGNTYGFGLGSTVEVQILHKPSGTVLFSGEVIAA